eukprot:1773072-Prymnesium_polylepis.1
MIAWTTPEFVFFSCPGREHWEKGKKKGEKPRVLQLSVCDEDKGKLALVTLPGDADSEPHAPSWTPVKFDATTHKDEDGL